MIILQVEESFNSVPNFIFIDTNIFLHYQDFDRIGWLKVLGIDAAKIVIPPVTVRELNKQKDTSSRNRIRNRAANTLRKLFDWFENNRIVNIGDGLDVVFEDRDPLIDFERFQLSREVQEDHLIASALMYQKETADAVVTLVTSDAGLTLIAKANRLRINAKKLDDRFKLPLEPDPDQERIKELEQKLRELKLTQPRLSLTFEEGTQHKTFSLRRPTQDPGMDIEAKLSEIKQRHPKLQSRSDGRQNRGKIGQPFEIAIDLDSLRFDDIAPGDITNYNLKIDEFYDSYAKYLQQQGEFEEVKTRTITLPIWIANDGTAPAEDIDVFMHFPDGFELIGENDFPSAPKLPRPPSKPKTRLEMLRQGFSLPTIPDLSTFTRLPAGIGAPPNITVPSIRRSKSYDVEVHIRRLKHHLQEPFDNMHVIFASIDAAQSFHIDYQILAANFPSMQSGSLHVIIEKN